MATIQDQKKLTKGKGWKNEIIFTRENPYKTLYEAITPSKKLKDKVKKIAEPFIEESVAIKHLTKKDKK